MSDHCPLGYLFLDGIGSISNFRENKNKSIKCAIKHVFILQCQVRFGGRTELATDSDSR